MAPSAGDDQQQAGCSSDAPDQTTTMALETMRLTTSDTMNRTKMWLEGRLPKNEASTAVARVACAALVSRLTNAAVDSTQISLTALAPMDTVSDNGTAPSEAEKPPLDSSVVKSSSETTSDRTNDVNNDNDGAIDDITVSKDGPTSNEEKKRGTENQAASTNPTEATGITLRGNLDGIKNEESSSLNTSTLVGLANDLADFLAKNENGANEKDDASLTVADIASRCLAVISDSADGSSNDAAADLFRSVVVAQSDEGKTQDSADSSESALKDDTKQTGEANFKNFLVTALRIIQRSAKSAVESRSDFEFMWKSCCSSKAFRHALKGLDANEEAESPNAENKPKEPTPSHNENGKRTREEIREPAQNDNISSESLSRIKECAWKLSCVATLQQQFLALSIENLSKVNEQAVEGALPQTDAGQNERANRRRKLLTIAACMGLLSSLSLESSVKDEEPEDTRNSEEPAPEMMVISDSENSPNKEQATPSVSPSKNEAEHDACNGEVLASKKTHSSGDELDSKQEEDAADASTSEVSKPLSKRQRLSIEDEAIAALSMMVSGTSSGGSSPLSSHSKSGNAEEVDSGDALDAILHSAHVMHTFLFLPHGAVGKEITREELEMEILALATMFSNFPGSGNNEDQSSLSKMTEDTPMSQSSDDSERRPTTELSSWLLPLVKDHSRFTDVRSIEEMFRTAMAQLGGRAQELNTEAPESPQKTDVNMKLIEAVQYVDENRLLSATAESVSRLCSDNRRTVSGGNYGNKTVAFVINCDTTSKYAAHANGSSPAEVTISSEPEEAAELVSSLRSHKTSDPMVSDALELNKWAVSILSLSRIKPSTRLLLYLEASDDEVNNKRKRQIGIPDASGVIGWRESGWRQVIIPVLNRALSRMKHAGIDVSSGQFIDSKIVTVDREEGEVRCDEGKICKAVVALFYHALETILFHETARMKSASHPRLVQSCPFHRGLLSCCHVSILKAVGAIGGFSRGGPQQDLDLQAVLQVMECTPYTYLKVSETFTRSLQLEQQRSIRSPVLGQLPRLLQQHLRRCEVLVMDSLMWDHERNYGGECSVMDVISELQRTPINGTRDAHSWPPELLQPNLPEEFEDSGESAEDRMLRRRAVKKQLENPDESYVSYLLRKLLKISYFRISALCSALEIPPGYPIASQIWVAFRYLLRHQIELLYGRHVDQLILCTLYGVCKIMKYEPDLTFAKIIEVYTKCRGRELGERECQKIVRRIRLYPDEDADFWNKKKHGNVIHLYNHIYVPAMKNHLLQSKSLKTATANLQRCRSEHHGRAMVSSSEAATSMADRVVNSSNGTWPEPTFIPIVEGNVKLNVRLPGLSFMSARRTSSQLKKKARRGKFNPTTGSLYPKTRAFYTFGGAGLTNLGLINRMLSQEKKVEKVQV